MTSYVYTDSEVKLTGRKALKTTTGRNSGIKSVSYLYEITPLSIEDGSWKKWVDMSELYQIIEEKVNNE